MSSSNPGLDILDFVFTSSIFWQVIGSNPKNNFSLSQTQTLSLPFKQESWFQIIVPSEIVCIKMETLIPYIQSYTFSPCYFCSSYTLACIKALASHVNSLSTTYHDDMNSRTTLYHDDMNSLSSTYHDDIYSITTLYHDDMNIPWWHLQSIEAQTLSLNPSGTSAVLTGSLL